MTADRIDKIYEKLDLLNEYVEILGKLRPMQKETLLNDKIVRGATERYLHLSAEVVIDVAHQLIAEYRLGTPDDYKDAIRILGKEGVLEKEFAQKFAPVAGFRNILVHDYAKLDYDEIVDKVNHELSDFETFAKQIANYLS